MIENTLRTYKKIFVALDGSDQQQSVLLRAVQIAKATHAELFIGHVVDASILEISGSYPVHLFSSLEQAFCDSIEEILAEIKNDPDIKDVHLLIKSGRIRETIQDEMLDVIKPDLVVCGARGLSNIKYALLGSISTYLIRASDTDVLVVK